MGGPERSDTGHGTWVGGPTNHKENVADRVRRGPRASAEESGEGVHSGAVPPSAGTLGQGPTAHSPARVESLSHCVAWAVSPCPALASPRASRP